jgi:hypothetical protein
MSTTDVKVSDEEVAWVVSTKWWVEDRAKKRQESL